MKKNIEKVTFSRLPQIKLTRVAAYCRVSTGKDTMLHSLSEQISYYSKLIQEHEGWLYSGVYADEAVSGTKNNRENYMRLLQDCRDGKIDLVITKSISRFARNTVTLLETVRELKSMGVGVYFEEQNINSLTADGELMLTILASYAQEEARSASENQKWRIRNDYENGILPLQHKHVYGYKRKENGEFEIVPEEAETVRLIFELFLAGHGVIRIARTLEKTGIPGPLDGHWSERTVRYMLSNEKYIGDLLLQKSIQLDFLTKKRKLNQGEKTQYYVQENHKAIISREVYEMVQQELDSRKAKYFKTENLRRYVFTHKMQCAICGKYYRRKISRGSAIWMCATYDRFGKSKCASRRIPEEVIISTSVELLGTNEFVEDVFTAKIETIIVQNENLLQFVFKDGHTEERIWQNRSRSQSWTNEMKEQARQKALKRRMNNVENYHGDTCDN